MSALYILLKSNKNELLYKQKYIENKPKWLTIILVNEIQ